MFDNDKSEKIIVERSMSSTYYFEHENVESEYFDVALTMGCKPDITFVLYASPEARKKEFITEIMPIRIWNQARLLKMATQ